MSPQPFTEEELQQYFSDPHRRRKAGENGAATPRRNRTRRWSDPYRAWLNAYFRDEKKVEAAFALSVLAGMLLVFTLGVGIYVLTLTNDIPSLTELENPNLNLATVAYTADGTELGRFGRENRSWVPLDSISPHVVNALVATEDQRFYSHWGVDTRGIMAAMADVVRKGDLRGASTISQQLARNLYNSQIGFDVSITRKLKEAFTAILLERRYTKNEIIEMYLNTVPFRYNAYGIEAAARTYFSKPASRLNVLESAALVGMLKANTRYDPFRNPENSRQRRNVVMRQMVGLGTLDRSFYETYKDSLTETHFRSSDVTDSFAPYFAEYVRNWLSDWGETNGIDVYAEGLIVHTTLDSRLQEMAQAATTEQMKGLQAVVDYAWSSPSYTFAQTTEAYLARSGYEPFAYFWEAYPDLLDTFIRETERYRKLRNQGTGAEAALTQLRQNEAFIDSLKQDKTRLEAGLLAIDPNTGYVKAWVGGRDLRTDWYDHVATAKRQPGSTFKPFVYTAAIDNGYSPNTVLPDTFYTYVDPVTGQTWTPRNSGGGASGEMLTLREGLARSKNTITAQVITQLIEPSTAAFYARRMGIQSPLEEVPSLALGTSDVSLFEMTAAYATLANGGLYYEPTVVTRIEDKNGNVLYEATPAPREALSEETAFTVIDMMRDVIEYGTAVRLRNQFNLHGYDFAGKTGTTQESADGWFMLMHPQLVTGAWVGFNDRRVTFRSSWWGQGAHNAMFVVGDFIQRTSKVPDVGPSINERFPPPEEYAIPPPPDELERNRLHDQEEDRGRVGW